MEHRKEADGTNGAKYFRKAVSTRNVRPWEIRHQLECEVEAKTETRLHVSEHGATHQGPELMLGLRIAETKAILVNTRFLNFRRNISQGLEYLGVLFSHVARARVWHAMIESSRDQWLR